MEAFDLDHAATTAVDPRVLEEMLPYFRENYGNPSALYGMSDVTREAIALARSRIAKCIGAKPEEIYFTAGGSEADNWAWKGLYFRFLSDTKKDGGDRRQARFITGMTEHHAILHTAQFLEMQGAHVTYLPVDEQGHISLRQLEAEIDGDTLLVSLMAANNEIGTLAPLGTIGKLARKHNVLFHTDAVQALGQIPLHVRSMNIDMLSASAHKLGGPKGTGFLFVREGILLENLIHGGGQEGGMRSGTENTAGIVGMGKACELACQSMELRRRKCTAAREYMIFRIMDEIPFARINGDRKMRLPGNISVTFQFVSGNALLSMLDAEGIYASTGSACNAASGSVSHVLDAIHLPRELAAGTLRFTIGDSLTRDDIDKIVAKLKNAVAYLRKENEEYHKCCGQ
ncbi:MAG: cysteine desulfurase [Lachnospiraceae bacterium]|nr:cysteine desulfurase [Lachnospiraceae bacterium]